MEIFNIGPCRTCYCFKRGEYPNDFVHTSKEILQLFDFILQTIVVFLYVSTYKS